LLQIRDMSNCVPRLNMGSPCNWHYSCPRSPCCIGFQLTPYFGCEKFKRWFLMARLSL